MFTTNGVPKFTGGRPGPETTDENVGTIPTSKRSVSPESQPDPKRRRLDESPSEYLPYGPESTTKLELEPVTNFPDLRLKSPSALRDLLRLNRVHPPDLAVDPVLVEKIQELVRDRVQAINEWLAYREKSSFDILPLSPPPSPTPQTFKSTTPPVLEDPRPISADPEDEDEFSIFETPDADMLDAFDKVCSGSSPQPLSPWVLDESGVAEIHGHLKTFALERFRTDQFEAIKATMEGRDVFVLIPTGGGKSLCFQLPAVCALGKTRGLTVVFSPLLALMHDQVKALKALNIDAECLSSESRSRTTVLNRLQMDDASKLPALLYISPEYFQKNHTIQGILSELYGRSLLARFVVDEAHCLLDAYFRNFRAAYRSLSTVRTTYPGVPIMALTATADPTTVKEIIRLLNMKDTVEFKQSFNRPNLNYRVLDVSGSAPDVDTIVNFIKEHEAKSTGIIYCWHTKECEKLAKLLKDKGLSAMHYHAGVTNREERLDQWKNGTCRIIVATIAFGLGIDKPDVRFVIHYNLPESLDGYYQETGRAGRDGLPALCLLYYTRDGHLKRLRAIRNDPDSTDDEYSLTEGKTKRELALEAVAQYCENKKECRRMQLLHHFGEEVKKKHCRSHCDNCLDLKNGLILDEKTHDITKEAKSLVSLVQHLESSSVDMTLLDCVAVFMGSNTDRIRGKGQDKNPSYGAGSDFDEELSERGLHKLVRMNVLVEKPVTASSAQPPHYYMRLGPKAHDFQAGGQTLELRDRYWVKPAENPIEASDKKDLLDETKPSVEQQTLLERLTAHRRAIMKRERLKNEEQVFSDEILKKLSESPPHDYIRFEELITKLLPKEQVQGRIATYGEDFVNICRSHNTALQRAADAPSSSTSKSSEPFTMPLGRRRKAGRSRLTGGYNI